MDVGFDTNKVFARLMGWMAPVEDSNLCPWFANRTSQASAVSGKSSGTPFPRIAFYTLGGSRELIAASAIFRGVENQDAAVVAAVEFHFLSSMH